MSLSNQDYIISQVSRAPAIGSPADAPIPAESATPTTGTTIQINSTKLYVPVVTQYHYVFGKIGAGIWKNNFLE